MGIPSRLIVAVISQFKEAIDKDIRRFQNLSSFLGIDINPKKKPAQEPVVKEASIEVEARAKGKIKEEIRNWFLQVMGDYLPIGYFDKAKRDSFEDRERMFQYLPDDLFDRMEKKIRQIIGEKAGLQGYKNLNTDDLILDDEIIDSKIVDLLGYYESNRPSLESVISKSLSPAKKETTEKRFEPGPGETWFTPTVSEALYNNYQKYINDHKEKFSQRADKENKEVKRPEDLGIFKNKADPQIIKILNEIKKFKVNIEDVDLSTDPKEKLPTVAITFSIPELAKKNAGIYGDILFTKKLPAKMRYLRPYKEYPVSVQYSGDRGLGIRFDDIYKEWEDNTSEAFKKFGFVDHESYRKFLSYLIDVFSQENIRKNKNLDEIIADLGGSIAIRDKSDESGKVITISSAKDLDDVMGFGGKEFTKEELRSKRKTEQVKKRYKWQENIVKDKLNKVVDAWNPKIQEYLFKLTPEEGKTMRSAVVKSGSLMSMRDFINKIKSGSDTKAGFRGLINTKEIADKALQFIFDEKTDPGVYAWKILLTDYIVNKGLEYELFKDAVKIILYKNFIESRGKKGEALKNELSSVGWDVIKSKYSDMDVKGFLNEQGKPGQGIDNGIKDLNKNIQAIIKSSENQPAFNNFFDRLRSWNAIVGKDLERKVERIIEGDDPSPIKVKEDLKAKMISEYEEQDPRVVDELKKLENKKNDLEKELKADKYDLESDEELNKLDKAIVALKDKTVKKERVDVTTPEGSKYLDQLVEYLIEERLQKAYIKQASYLNIINMSKNFLK